ncbi:MAG: biotin/lipoyl-binding protein [Acidobacteria bacterium]|nr:biotin/lipoyl-binding protein [Acidobacteriota bacterium]
MTSRLRSLTAFAVWGGSVYFAWWLYHSGGTGTYAAVAVAQAKVHRVSPTQLGRLMNLDVKEGQRVAAGQVIARLDTELLQREMSVAQAQMKQAASDVQATGVNLDVNLLQAERAFESEVEAATVELTAARSDAAGDRTELSQLQDDLKREQDLVRRGLTRSDRMLALNQRRAALEEAVNNWPRRVESLQARHQAASSRLVEWRKAHSNGNGARAAQLQPLAEKVKERIESVHLLRAQVHAMVLRASTDSYVSIIHARPGDVLRPGDPIVTLVENQPSEATAYVDERRGTPIPPGTQVVARRRSAPAQQFEAVVTSVAANVDTLPQRLWSNPAIPAWGRAMYVALPPEAALEPGELLDIAMPAPSGPGIAQWIRLPRAQADGTGKPGI